ncbi:MAG: CRISPR-associated helicase Cas3' [Clostridium lundense]|nr:CRISPR-associated helicase Cas3' [Clostridium lundense]
MKNLFLAKTKDKESITKHTDELYKNYLTLKEMYPYITNLDWSILKVACLYHDLGKMNAKFQNKLIRKLKSKDSNLEELNDTLKSIDEIPHGYLSPAFLPKDKLVEIYNSDDLRILYQSIYFHHSREKLANHDGLKIVVTEDLEKYIDEFEYDKIDKIEKLYPSFIRFVKRRIPDVDDTEETVRKYIMTKGLLNKIDYAASGGIDVEVQNKDLLEKTMKSITKGGYKPNKLQEYMLQHKEDNNVIRASTGIGKTEAALFWIGNNKGFFTLPLRVSINAIYDRVIDKIEFSKDGVALLHSDTASEYLKRNDNELDLEYYAMTKQLSLPLTICTLDQLVDFIFKYEGFELKLATLAYSKLIIDEIQMYAPEMVAFLIAALKYITDMGGKFSIVTATLPPIFLYFMDKQNIRYEKPEPFYKEVNGKIQLRHKMRLLNEDININHIKENYKDKKVLVIVNTVKKAQELYEELKKELKDKVEINLFHSRFIKRDRAKKEDEIFTMGQLDNNSKGIWITTQVVEASLDIDFDVLYTELSDASGLFQRMGRVYRNRDLQEEFINIYVYLGNEKLPSGIGSGDKSIIDKDIFDLSKKALINYVGKDFKEKEIDEKDKMELVEQVYSIDNLKNKNYYNKIDKVLKSVIDIKAFEIDKKEVNLRNIETKTIMPKKVYEDNKEIIDKNIKIISEESNVSKKLISKNLINELTLSVPSYMYESAKNNGYVEECINVDKYNELPVVSYNYDFEKGLTYPEKPKKFNEDMQCL